MTSPLRVFSRSNIRLLPPQRRRQCAKRMSDATKEEVRGERRHKGEKGEAA